MPSKGEFVMEVRGLCKTYSQGRWWQKQLHCRALDNVSLSLRPGETLGLVGESGSGKTTLAMCLVGLETFDAGEVFVNGMKREPSAGKKPSFAGREIQLIFQDSSGALNPRMSAREIVEEPMLIRGQCSRSTRRELAKEMLERVGIPQNWCSRRPREFSGGQRQRIAIARALVLQPKALILDEVFVGLDLSIQGQIANLLLDLQEARGLSYLCISHNLALVGHFADAIAVMDRGRIVEKGTVEELFSRRGRPPISSSPHDSPKSAFSAGTGA